MNYIDYTTIGKYIENKKKSQKISSKDLCRGICSLATYSRLINSESTPDLLLLNCILERLGLDPNNINISYSEQELRFFIFRNKIETAKNKEIAQKLLSEYIAFNINSKINTQFIEMIQGYICLFKKDKAGAISSFSSALNRTNLKYPFSDKIVLHRYEFESFYQLSILKNNISNLLYLYNYLQHKPDENYLKKSYYCKISISLAKTYAKSNNYKSANMIINNAIHYIQKENQIAHLLELLSLKSKFDKKHSENLKDLKDACKSINTILINLENNEYI